jgi:DNA repair exonuclease SbcCD ATPase subunit
MSSLAHLPEIVGFFSYSREDDEAFEGTLSALRDAIQRELSAQLGRSKTNFRLWQDQKAIAPSKRWETEIKTAVEQAVFFIPIVTPRAVNSHYCKLEFDAFLAREQELGRGDLVFPLLHIRVPALESEAQWRSDPVLSIVGMRQYVDWRGLRNREVREPAVREAIERFCEKIAEALREPWVSPEVRRRQEAEAARLIEEERQRAEAARLAEEERQRVEAARLAEERRKRAEAARLAEEERQRTEAERLVEEQKKRAEAARLVEEQKKRAEAARLAEEERQRAEAARLGKEREQRDKAARLESMILELSKQFESRGYVYVYPRIPPRKEKNARNALNVPADDFVWILIDHSVSGNAEGGLCLCFR